MTTITNFKHILRGLIDLCELQFQLLSIDGKVAASKAIVAMIAMGLAGAASLAAFTTLMISGGWAFHEFLNWPLSGGLLTSAALGLLIVVLLVAIAYSAGKKAAAALEETRSEFSNNIRWLKTMLKADSEPMPTQDYTPFTDRFERKVPEHDRAL